MFQLKVPVCCMECPVVMKYGDMTVCGSNSFTPEEKLLDITAFKVDPKKRPDWCPTVRANKLLQEMPKEKRKAYENIYNGLKTVLSEIGIK